MQDRYRFRFWNKETNKWFHFGFETFPTYEKEIWKALTDGEKIYQSTGSKDDNGKLMYEGDIVKIWKFSKDLHGDNKRIIKWNDARCGFRLYTIDQHKRGIENCPQSMVNVTTIEVIGNIFQNPELLSEVK